MGKGGANTINLERLGRKTPSSARHFFSLPPLAVLSMSTFAHCVARARSTLPFLLQSITRGEFSSVSSFVDITNQGPQSLPPSLPLGVREYKGGEGTGCATGLSLRFVGTRFL